MAAASNGNPYLRSPLGFAGGLHDWDTGLVRFGWRDYDPDTGRFTAQDPIGAAGGDPDWYGYCLDDPVNGRDPEGLKTKNAGVDSDYAARNASCPAGVWECERPARIAGGVVNHYWLKTNKSEAGMGNAQGGVVGNQPDSPYVTDTEITDPSRQSGWNETYCECVPDANATIVDKELKLGRPTGKWTFGNHCKTEKDRILRKAGSTKGELNPDI